MADTERFLWVDLSVSSRDDTRLTVYERPHGGCGLMPLRTSRCHGENIHEIALRAANLCCEYGCRPLMDVGRLDGAHLLNHILQLIGG